MAIKRKYWYKTTFDFCPACGRESTFKERVYGKKPKSHKRRFLCKETYDHCIERGRF